jgi:murein DD-endopeptidase MepM/ murein hydrolase activator NlpD
VQSGDTVPALARRFGVEPQLILDLNPGLAPAQTLPPGQILNLPAPLAPADFTQPLFADSRVIFAPGAENFDVRGFVLAYPGFLAGYSEVLNEGEAPRAGWELVALYARRYSLDPRLLLALLEFQSHALSAPAPDDFTREHALGVNAPNFAPGLSHQLGFAVNQINLGYYGWRSGQAPPIETADGARYTAAPNVNAGTYAVVRLLGLLYRSASYPGVIAPDGFSATYQNLFGDPLAGTGEPLIPGGLTQPELQLPFEPGRVWTFTTGPHPAFGRGSPHGALDFAPPVQTSGCVDSFEWVAAARAGVVTFSSEGLVLEDVGEGWTVLYLHVATRDRAPAGAALRAGDRVGHPSCEGGEATATHLHLARLFRGEFIPVDGFAPLVLSGWTAHGQAGTYLGTLTRDGRVIQSCPCAAPSAEISLEP